MKRLILIACGIVLLLAPVLHAQSRFERLDPKLQKLSAVLLGYHNTGDSRLDVRGFGTASLYWVPLTTNDDRHVISVVTVSHNLKNKKDGRLFDGLLLKLNMPSGKPPRYVDIPLKHDEPRNYWLSEQGFDLAVIPIPPESIEGADTARFKQDQIVTPESATNKLLDAGLIVEVICMQPDYLDPFEFHIPEIMPALRVGHLSRIGFYRNQNGMLVVRPHLVDIHSSPGNSGATVVVNVPKPDGSVAEPMFLGVIQGFKEEADSYLPYSAPITNAVTETTLNLVSSDGHTNQVAVAIKTPANPNLSLVTPVHELATILSAPRFAAACMLMGSNKSRYRLMDSTQVQKAITDTQPTNAPYSHPAPQAEKR